MSTPNANTVSQSNVCTFAYSLDFGMSCTQVALDRSHLTVVNTKYPCKEI